MAIKLKRGSGAPGALAEGEPAIDLTNGVIYVGASGGSIKKALMSENDLSDIGSASTCRTNLGLAIGTNVQAYDATLSALAAYNTNGILTQTAADTFTGRTITGTTNQVVVANGDGVSGNPTLSLPQNIHTGASPQFAGANFYGEFASFTFTSPTYPTNGTFVGLNGAGTLHVHQRESTKDIEFLVNYVTKIKVNSTGLGFFGASPVGQASNTAAATDLASVITLANACRTILKNLGFMA